MKRQIHIIVAAIFMISFLGLAVFADEMQKPKAVFLSKSHNFGPITEGKKVSTVFYFKNTGTADLLVKKIRTSCGCTAVLLSSDTIKPGDTGELKVSFDSSGFKGKIEKSIYFHSNDPDNPVVQLIIKSVVL
jgi:hypothetical protein